MYSRAYASLDQFNSNVFGNEGITFDQSRLFFAFVMIVFVALIGWALFLRREVGAIFAIGAGLVTAQALRRDFGVAKPRVAVSGLNPHAGESGTLGREEIEIIGPAIRALKDLGVDAKGPYPADTLFPAETRAT